ncbi:acyl carrier protein [Kitasatospora sp. NPDC006697]|uniref:acyl carrier protein n=1 Tax=Kitasatospora sp. NPDC006697 TaxID=3364020 RepID=UPI003694046F
MSTPVLPDRAEVVGMLAAFGQRAASSVPEALGSLELTWLVAEFEQRYAVELELSDERFAAVRTVDDAVAVLRAAVLAADRSVDPSAGPSAGPGGAARS